MDKNPTLKPQLNQKIYCKFNKTEPFASGANEGQYGKTEWYGYNLQTQVEEEWKEYTWFASKSAHRLIQHSGIEAGVVCSIELSSFEGKDGEQVKVWKLDDRTFNQWYAQQDAINTATAPIDYTDTLNSVTNNIKTIEKILAQHASTINEVIKEINQLKK